MIRGEEMQKKEDHIEEILQKDDHLENEEDMKQEEKIEKTSEELEEENPQEEKIEENSAIKVKDLENKLEDTQQRILRLQADFDNYKKRVAKEKENLWNYASEEIVKALLPVIDNFERALSSLEEKGGDKDNVGYIQGVQMVYNQFIEVLKKEGLEEISALGEPFDPNIHHAVAQESKDDCEDNSIIEVYQKGYKIKDKVIRPSMVKVCIH